MKKAITHLKLDNANRHKLNELDKVVEAYLSLVQAYVDHIFDHDLRDVNKYDPLLPIATPLSARWQRCAWQHACGIMQSFYSNERTNKPVLRSVTIQANANVVVIEPSRSPHFDYWLRISTLDKGHPIRIPITLYDKARASLQEGKLCSGVTLARRDDQWYATLVVDIPNAKPKPNGRRVGVDIGIVNILTTSTGRHFGHFSDKFKAKVDRATEKRRRKQKLNACLEKKGLPTVSLSNSKLSVYVKNEIGRALNGFVGILCPNDQVVLEQLSVKGMRFKSRRMNRMLSAAQLGYLYRRVREKLDYAHIRYRSVWAAYSSQECAKCGYVDRKNRPSRDKFCCLWCGNVDNADVNAGKVLVKRFDDAELINVGDYREVKAILLERFYRMHSIRDRFPDARSASGGLELRAISTPKGRFHLEPKVNQPA